MTDSTDDVDWYFEDSEDDHEEEELADDFDDAIYEYEDEEDDEQDSEED